MSKRRNAVGQVLAPLGLALLVGCVEVRGTSSPDIPAPTALMVAPVSIPSEARGDGTVSGFVLDETGAAVRGAVIRQQATENSTSSLADGSFILRDLAPGLPITISAWAEGYYCANVVDVTSPAEGITFVLRDVQTADNPDYPWIPPLGEGSCYSCKSAVTQVWLDNDAQTPVQHPLFSPMNEQWEGFVKHLTRQDVRQATVKTADDRLAVIWAERIPDGESSSQEIEEVICASLKRYGVPYSSAPKAPIVESSLQPASSLFSN